MLSTRSVLRSAAICSVGTLALFAHADFKIVSHVTMKMDMGPMNNQQQTTTTYFKNGMMRVETSDGAVFLFNSKTKKSYMLRTATKQYSEFTMYNLAGPMGGASNKFKAKVSAHLNPTKQKSTILGKPANLYKADMTLDMDMGMGAMHADMHMDQWTTTAMRDKVSAKETMAAMAEMLQGLAALGADTKQLVKEFSKMKGVPLNSDIVMKMKMKRATTATTPPGNPPSGFTMNINSRVQSISEAPVSADLFKIPAGYTKTDSVFPHRGMGSGGR